MPYKFEKPESNKPTMGIYIHIPFCVKKCDYCDFFSVANATPRDKKLFHNALIDQLAQCRSDADDRVIDTVYIGGGTPSCYGADLLADLLIKLRERYDVSPDCEITVECNPDTTTERLLTRLKAVGVNRLSMGVQSACNGELKQVGRIHDFATAQGAFRLGRKVGFDNLSLDLIYGLPGQTMVSWQQSVEAILELEPDHLSCYGLKVEEGTPLYEHQYALTMADDDTQADMYLWMVERLERAGYGQYEISNFARPGKHSRHNMRYWLGQEYIGLGPSAHHYLNGCRGAIVRSLEDYSTGVLGCGQFWEPERRIDRAEQIREYVLLQMRTTWGIGREEYESRYGLKFDPLETQLEAFRDYGWTVCEDTRWHFTPKGFLVSNALIGQLLDAQEPYLPE